MDTLPFHLLDDILLKLDPKSLAMMQCADRSINLHINEDPYFKSVFKKDRYEEGLVHGNDLRANKWGGVMDWIPRLWDGKRDFDQFKPSLSSSMEVDEEVDVDMTMVNDDDDKRISSISKFMRRIGGISPYAQSLFKKKETPLGKRLMIEDETKLRMMTEEPSSKFMDAAERINKRRRFK